jgi:hypothetical protein
VYKDKERFVMRPLLYFKDLVDSFDVQGRCTQSIKVLGREHNDPAVLNDSIGL